MAESSALIRLRGLILNAAELQALTNWPLPLIEDYLNLFDNLISIAETIDTGASMDVQIITTDYSVEENDGTILMNANGNSVTADLPLTHVPGQEHNFKSIDDTYGTYIDPNGSPIDGDTAIFELFQDESLRVRSDGTNWWIL